MKYVRENQCKEKFNSIVLIIFYNVSLDYRTKALDFKPKRYAKLSSFFIFCRK